MLMCLCGPFRSRLADRFDYQLKLEVKKPRTVCGLHEKLQFVDDTQRRAFDHCFQFQRQRSKCVHAAAYMGVHKRREQNEPGFCDEGRGYVVNFQRVRSGT